MVKLTKHFGIDPWVLHEAGAFDVPLNGPDAHVYLDPRRLRRSAQPEFQGALEDVAKHYAMILHKIEASSDYPPKTRTMVLQAAEADFQAPELDGLRIGYSRKGGKGHGLGPKKAAQMMRLAKQLMEDGLGDPVLFEVFTVVEEGIGADLISDLMAHIIRPRLWAFSERVARDLDLPTKPFDSGDRTYGLPWNQLKEEHLVLPPKDALADIVSFNRSQRFDSKAFGNAGIRKAFDEAMKQGGAPGLRSFLRTHHQERDQFIEAYRASLPPEHDYFLDEGGIAIAAREVQEAVVPSGTKPLLVPPESAHELFCVVVDLAERFGVAAEAGRLRRLFHSNSGPRKEADIQEIFGAFVALACEDMDIMVTPESDRGSGPSDFVFSRGAGASVVLEIKLSKSSSIIRNYDHQVQAYQDAHGAHHGVYLVVVLSDDFDAVKRLVSHHENRTSDVRRPYLVIADGRHNIPASKMYMNLEPLSQIMSQPRVSPIVSTSEST